MRLGGGHLYQEMPWLLRPEHEECVIRRSEHSRQRHSMCKGPEVGSTLAYQATERCSVRVGLSEQRGSWEEMRLERQEGLMR